MMLAPGRIGLIGQTGRAANIGVTVSQALAMLSGEDEGFAADFTDTLYPTGSAAVIDTGTPANDFDDAAQGAFDYTGSSAKWMLNNGGVYVENPAGTLPIDYAVGGGRLGLRPEEQRTNLLTYSQAFDNAAWGKNGLLSVTGSAALGPDGSTSAYKITESTEAGPHRLLKGFSSTNPVISLIFAKASEREYVAISLYNGSIYSSAVLSLIDGSLTASNGTITGLAAIDYGNGWWLISATKAANISAVSFCICGSATPSFSGGLPQYTGDGSSGVYLWQADLQAGAFPTSPIPTAATTVTRAGDAITKPTSEIPYSATNGTLVLSGRTAIGLGAGSQVLCQFDDGTSSERIRIERDSSGDVHCIVTDGGSPVADLDLGAVADETDFTVALSWAADDFAASLDGASVVTDTGGTLPTVDTFRLGSSSSGEQWNGHIGTVKYLPRTMSDVELEAASA